MTVSVCLAWSSPLLRYFCCVDCLVAILAQGHFCSRRHWFSVSVSLIWCWFLLHPGKTSPHAAQGMEPVRCPQWVGADPPRSASKGSPVAESIFTASSSAGSAGPEAFCAPFSKDRLRGCPIAVAQPFTCDSRCRGSCRSQAVASRHRSSRGEQCPREGPPRSPPRCSEQSQVATDPGTVGVVQDVPRTCTEAGSSSPGCDRQGHRAEGHVRIGGDGGSTQTRGSPGRSCADASTTRDAFNCVGVAGEDRHQPGVSKHSDKWMEEGPPCVENIPPMPSTNVQEQRSQLRTPQCGGVRRHEFGGQDRTSGWARGQPTRVNWQRCDHDRSIEVFLMSSLIDAAEAKRRCIAASSVSGLQQW